MENSGLEGAMRDRLLLTSSRIHDMARGVREVAALPDPIGETLAEWTKSNGLRIRKVRVPLGVVGIIYESRPNVTVDTAALALKSGNAIVLRGGKEASHSSRRLVEIMNAVPGLPEGAIELLDSSTRQTVQDLIKAHGLVDVIIPRGGAGLIKFVAENSSVPVIETGAGTATSSSTNRPISKWPIKSSSMPKLSAPRSATPPKNCWCINASPRNMCPASSRSSSTPGLKSEAMAKLERYPPDYPWAPRPSKTGTKSISGCAWPWP